MGFFDRFSKKGGHISRDTAMMITESGKDALAGYGGSEKGRILLALETRGSGDMEQISSASGLTIGQIEREVPSLLRNRYVRFVATGGVGEDL